MERPKFLNNSLICEDCDECYGVYFVVIGGEFKVHCEKTGLNIYLTDGYGLITKYNKAIEVLQAAGEMLGNVIVDIVSMVIPDIKFYVDGETIQLESELRKGNPDKGSVQLDNKLNKFFKKRYDDILFDFDSFFSVWITKKEWKEIEKELKKEFEV